MLYTSDLSSRVRSSGVYTLMFYLTIVNKKIVTVTFFCEQLFCKQFLLAAALSVYSTKNLNTLVFLQI